MAGNQETAIFQALSAGDIQRAREAYDAYVTSMERAQQKPKSQSYFGIPKRP